MSLVYLIFSCCYVTKCPKFGISALKHKGGPTLQKAATPAEKKSKHPAGNFLSRPRVISHDNKTPGIFCLVLILSSLFIGFNNKRHYSYLPVAHFKYLYRPDLVISLGNLKI